jgi:hypothetical protein
MSNVRQVTSAPQFSTVIPKLTREQSKGASKAVELHFAGLEEKARAALREEALKLPDKTPYACPESLGEYVTGEVKRTAEEKTEAAKFVRLFIKLEKDIGEAEEKARKSATTAYARATKTYRANIDKQNEKTEAVRDAWKQKASALLARLKAEKDAALLAVQFNGDAHIIGQFLAGLPGARSLSELAATVGLKFGDEAQKQLVRLPDPQ